MRKIGFVFLLLAAVVLISACQSSNQEGSIRVIEKEGIDDSGSITDETTSDDSGTDETPREYTIVMTDSGYNPRSTTINQGDTIVFVNEGNRDAWPATAFHPTHTIYPGSDIQKCGGPERGMIFDACRRIGSGGSYSFTFNEVGEWKYHDHLNPSFNGAITVR